MSNILTTKEVSGFDIARDWLEHFGAALEQANVSKAMELVLEDSWWRDLLSFTWDHRSFQGKDNIEKALKETLEKTKPGAFQLEPSKAVNYSEDTNIIESFFVFETEIAWGRGFLRLKQTNDGVWKAWTLLTTMDGLKGHEEQRGFRRPKGIDGLAKLKRKNWLEQRQEALRFENREPQVLVIGAGQAGLAVAARLGHLGVDTLVVEQNARVGDNWRQRYHSLVLHDPIWFDHLPYMPFPDNFPVFIPKDKLAGWFEHYASAMELNIWTATALLGADFESGNT